MAEAKGLTIELDMNTNNLSAKLKAIAKHAEALANELDAIDHGWKCLCGSTDYEDTIMFDAATDEAVMHERKCNDCHNVISMLDEVQQDGYRAPFTIIDETVEGSE